MVLGPPLPSATGVGRVPTARSGERVPAPAVYSKGEREKSIKKSHKILEKTNLKIVGFVLRGLAVLYSKTCVGNAKNKSISSPFHLNSGALVND